MKLMIKALVVAAAVAASGAQAEKLGNGLTLPILRRVVAAEVQRYKEAASENLRDCTERPTRDGKGRAYQCHIGEHGMMDGAMYNDGKLARITVSALVGSVEDVHLFERAAKYAIYAAQGTRDIPAGMTVLHLMSDAFKRPGEGRSVIENGLHYTMEYGRSAYDPSIPMWTLDIDLK
jgi:hypothetical protein